MNAVDSPGLKLQHIPYTYQNLALIAATSISNSQEWTDFLVNLGVDTATWVYKLYEFHSLFIPASKLNVVTRFISNSRIKRGVQPPNGMDVKQYRGYELQIDTMSMTSALLGMGLTGLVMVPFMPDSFVTTLWFGDDREKRYMKLAFLLVAWAFDMVQDLVSRSFVATKTDCKFTYLYYTIFKRENIVSTVNNLLYYHWFIPVRLTCSAFWSVRGLGVCAHVCCACDLLAGRLT